MSRTIPEKPPDSITEQDLFGSIPRALDINPFEGINLTEMRILSECPDRNRDDDWEYVEINPIQGIDIADMSVAWPGRPARTGSRQAAATLPAAGQNCVLIFVGKLVSALPVPDKAR